MAVYRTAMPAPRTHRPRRAPGRTAARLAAGQRPFLFLFVLYAVLLRALIPVGSMPAAGGGLAFVTCTGAAQADPAAHHDPAQAPHDEPQAHHAPCAFTGFGPMLAGAAPVAPQGDGGSFDPAAPIRAGPGPARAIPYERPPATGPPARIA